MAQFATADDLATRLGLTLSTDDETRATTLLGLASGVIQDEVQKTIALVEDDTITMPGTTDDRIRLPETPVVSVSSVTLDNTPLVEGADWYLDGNTVYRMLASTTIMMAELVGINDDAFTFPLGVGFGWPTQTLEIVYSHGYPDDAVPQTVKAICLEMVVRVWVNPGSVARETVGNLYTIYDNMRFSPAGLLLTDDERVALWRLFGRRAKTVTILGG